MDDRGGLSGVVLVFRDITLRRQAAEAETLRLGLAEVEATAPEAGEDSTLLAEEEKLANADALHAAATTAHEALLGDPTASNDGVDAVAFLRRKGEFSNAPRPGLILLDLNLPRMDGREVLAEIMADESLRSIPVVVLTTSEAEEDVLRSYDLHANAYVTKPVDFERFIRVVQHIDDFFVSVVKLPR